MGKSNIEIILSAKDTNLLTIMRKGQMAVKAFTAEVSGGSGQLASMRAQVLQLAGAFAGLSAIGEVGAMLKTADQNAFAMAASIKAANREFAVGSAGEWEQTIADLSQKLKIYSQSDIKGATARTIDMTKRLGLNAEQMKRVIELSADLAAGRTDLEGGVERVTAALRGEAESAEFLGLTMNETYVKAWYEASAAHEKAWKDLSDLEKAQVRYQVFLEQSIPLHGKAAESVNTWSGALALVRTTVADNISTSENLIDSLKGVADVLRDNAADIGQFAAEIANGAAAAIKFAANNREVIGEVVKYGAAFGAAAIAVGRLAAAWRGLNAAMAVMTGMQIVPWLRALEASTAGAVAGLNALKIGFVGLMGATAAFFAAYKLGEWVTMRADMQALAAAQGELERQTAKVTAKFREISATTGVTVRSMEELDQAVKEGRLHYDELTATWKDGSAQQQAATKQTAAVSKQATAEAVTAMRKKYQDYVTEVKRLQGEIRDREKSLAAELRGMARTGMTDTAAWADQKKEAKEYEEQAKKTAAEAKRAFQSGDTITAREKWKEALALADQAKQAYSSLNTEVKNGDQVVIDKAAALKIATDGVKGAGEMAIGITRDMEKAMGNAAEAMKMEAALQGINDLTEGMDEAEKRWLENYQDMQDFAVGAIDKVEERLVAMISKERTVWINVKEVVQKATGGPIGFARGGKLPGYGGGDRISALLEAGEYVIRKEAVSKFGSGLFHALNSLRLPEIPRFAAGGSVSASPSEIHALDISLGGSYAGRLTGSPVDVRAISKAFAKADRLRSS